jgi:uncharacterized protein (TIGR00369 family)
MMPGMDDILTRARAFIDTLPHSRALGMRVERFDDGHAVLSMPYDRRLIGDPVTGVLHGGAISALMDTASGASVMAHPTAPASTATLDLRIDYMRPAVPGQRVTAHAHCFHITRTVAFVRVIASDDDADRPVATGAAAFTLTGGANVP